MVTFRHYSKTKSIIVNTIFTLVFIVILLLTSHAALAKTKAVNYAASQQQSDNPTSSSDFSAFSNNISASSSPILPSSLVQSSVASNAATGTVSNATNKAATTSTSSSVVILSPTSTSTPTSTTTHIKNQNISNNNNSLSTTSSINTQNTQVNAIAIVNKVATSTSSTTALLSISSTTATSPIIPPSNIVLNSEPISSSLIPLLSNISNTVPSLPLPSLTLLPQITPDNLSVSSDPSPTVTIPIPTSTSTTSTINNKSVATTSVISTVLLTQLTTQGDPLDALLLMNTISNSKIPVQDLPINNNTTVRTITAQHALSATVLVPFGSFMRYISPTDSYYSADNNLSSRAFKLSLSIAIVSGLSGIALMVVRRKKGYKQVHKTYGGTFGQQPKNITVSYL